MGASRSTAGTALLLGLALCAGCASDDEGTPALTVEPDTTAPALFEVRLHGTTDTVCYVWNAGGLVASGEFCVPDGATWPALEPIEFARLGDEPPDGGWCAFVTAREHENGIVMDWQGDFPPTSGTGARRACK